MTGRAVKSGGLNLDLLATLQMLLDPLQMFFKNWESDTSALC